MRLITVLASSLIASSAWAAPSPAPSPAQPVDRYVAEALVGNPGLAAQRAAVEAGAQAYELAKARRRPSLGLTARYTESRGGRTIELPTGDLLNPVYDFLNAQLVEQGQAPAFPTIGNEEIGLLQEQEQDTRLTLSTPIYSAALNANVRAQRSQYAAQTAERERAARDLVRAVRAAYYAAAQAEAGERILQASVALLREDVRVAESLVSAGKATRDRALRAEAEALAVEQQLDAQRSQRAQAVRLVNALRDAPIDAEVDLRVPESRPGQEPPLAASIRPELIQLDQSIAASDAAEQVAGASLIPSLAFAADAGYTDDDYEFSSETDVATASLVLTWTWFDFGQTRAAKAQAAAQTESLRAQRQELQRNLELERRAAEDDQATALRAVVSSEARLVAADEAFRIAQRKRDAGSLSQVEFLDAERALTDARLNVVIARYTALDRGAELERVYAAYPLPLELLAQARPE